MAVPAELRLVLLHPIRRVLPRRPDREGAWPPLACSAEDDIEGAGQSGLLGLGRWPQRNDQPGAGGGVAHAHQQTVALVLRLAGDVHLRDETRETRAGDREMD